MATSAPPAAPGSVELASGGVDLRVVGRAGIIGRFILVPSTHLRVSAERVLVSIALANELGLALAPPEARRGR